jgi:hypothetical protein
MNTRALLVGCGLLLASFGPAFADNLTAIVTNWDFVNRIITLEDLSQFTGIPNEVAVPSELKAGNRVMIDFEATEDGVQAINSITIVDRAISRRLPPLKEKKG